MKETWTCGIEKCIKNSKRNKYACGNIGKLHNKVEI